MRLGHKQIRLGLLVGVLTAAGILAYWAVTARRGSDDWRNRERAVIVQSTVLPSEVVWSRLVAAANGVLVLGEKGPAAVAGLLDDRLRVRSVVELPGPCHVLDAEVAGDEGAMVACAGTSAISWKGVIPGEGALSVREFGSSQLLVASTPPARRGPRLRTAARDRHHFWLVERSPGQWSVGRGTGLAPPEFGRSITQDVSAFAPCSATDLAVVSTGPQGNIVLALVRLDSPNTEETPVSTRPGRYPRVLCVGNEILVFWVETQTEASNPFSVRFTHILTRRYDRSLVARSGAERVSPDDHVIPLNDYPTKSGAVLVWSQGVRGPWDSVSFLSIPDSRSAPIRLPIQELPLSIVQVGEDLALLPRPDAARNRAQEVLVVAGPSK